MGSAVGAGRRSADPRPELQPFLGSQLLAEAIDSSHVDLALHGHGHAGAERGATAGGTPVRNVAVPVIGCAYRVFEFARDRDTAADTAAR